MFGKPADYEVGSRTFIRAVDNRHHFSDIDGAQEARIDCLRRRVLELEAQNETLAAELAAAQSELVWIKTEVAF